MADRKRIKEVEEAAENADYLKKQKRIKSEITRLKRIFKDIDPNKKNLVISTIHDIAFMNITMVDMRESIIDNWLRIFRITTLSCIYPLTLISATIISVNTGTITAFSTVCIPSSFPSIYKTTLTYMLIVKMVYMVRLF